MIIRFALIVGLLLFVGCNSKESSEKPTSGQTKTESKASEPANALPKPCLEFADKTLESGINQVYRNGSEASLATILESLGGGVGVLDFDRDGESDLFFPSGGTISKEKSLTGLPSHLFHGIGAWKFEDSSTSSRIDDPLSYSHGVAVADFDNDGFPDVAVTGYRAITLWHNQGDGTFIEISQPANMVDDLWGSSAAWGDINGDGNLDLYVCHYVDWSFENDPFCAGSKPDIREICSPRMFNPLPDSIFLSDASGKFQLVRQEIGLRPDGKGLGVVIADINRDGAVEIYVGNDTTDNFLYQRKGDKLEELGITVNVALDDQGKPNGSMGVEAVDYDRDGNVDVFAANYENEAFALYRANGKGRFVYASNLSGISSLDGSFVAFGSLFHDFDHDGDEDLAVVNGHVLNEPFSGVGRRQYPLLLESVQQRGTTRFLRQRYSDSNYFGKTWEGRGLAGADFDHDGDIDLVVSNVNEPSAILENVSAPHGKAYWVELIGARQNRDCIGATVILETDKSKMLRLVKGGASYMSSSPYLLHFGIPTGEVVQRLAIVWPGGAQSEVVPPQETQFVRVIEE